MKFSILNIEPLSGTKANSDSNGIYLDGKRIVPDISYFLIVANDDVMQQVKLPKSMHMELDRLSYKEEFVTREQIWKEDPTAQQMDESIEKLNSEK